VSSKSALAGHKFSRLSTNGAPWSYDRLYNYLPYDFGSGKKAFTKFPLIQFTAEANKKDLDTLASLVEEGKTKVHIDKNYSYDQIPEAISYVEAMRTRGKVAMIWENSSRDNKN
jgi:NADPH:quinone reductase-like Zn-dependent oxidoreductase